MRPAPLDVPRLRAVGRHAIPHLVEGTLIPLGLFYLALWAVGVWGGLAIALAWSYGALARRLLLRRRIPALLVLGAAGLTLRTLVAVATGSVFFYFLQPTLATVALAGAFLVSVPIGRPLAERLAADFVPFPAGFVAHPAIRRFFLRITLLWGLVQLVNAAATIWLLVSQPLATYLWSKTVVQLALTGGAIVFSAAWFRLTLRRHGLLARRVATMDVG